MAGTQTNSIRSTTVVDGSNKYVIVTTCTVAGTLPDTNVFLLAISTANDPKDDVLLRVIEVADIGEYLTDRDDAIDAGSVYWRAPSMTLQFDDIETANAAWKEVESRLSTLVEQVDAYNDEFETEGTGDVTVYPTADLSEKKALEEAFLATAEPITDAETARDEQQAKCTLLEASLGVTQERLEEAQTDLTRYLQAQAEVGGVSTALPSINAAISTANTQARVETALSAASDLEKSSIAVQYNAIDVQLSLFTTQNSALATTLSGPIAAAVAALQSRVTSLTSDKSTTLNAMNVCSAEVAALEGEVDAARAARETALANVLAVCPNSTP